MITIQLNLCIKPFYNVNYIYSLYMGLDIDKLLNGLINYKDCLSRHLLKLQEDFDLLMNTFLKLNQEYAGQRAEDFKNSWNRTARWFESYIDNAKILCKNLQDRIESLRKVEKSFNYKQPGLNYNLENLIKNNTNYHPQIKNYPYIPSIKYGTKSWNTKQNKQGKTELNLYALTKFKEMPGVQNINSYNYPNMTPNWYKINKDLSRLIMDNPFQSSINYPFSSYNKRGINDYSYLSVEELEELINSVLKKLCKNNIISKYELLSKLQDEVIYKYHNRYILSQPIMNYMMQEIEKRYYQNLSNSINFKHPYY